jgi:hypothetical protein
MNQKELPSALSKVLVYNPPFPISLLKAANLPATEEERNTVELIERAKEFQYLL